jgi:hypothetical protein
VGESEGLALGFEVDDGCGVGIVEGPADGRLESVGVPVGESEVLALGFEVDDGCGVGIVEGPADGRLDAEGLAALTTLLMKASDMDGGIRDGAVESDGAIEGS